MADLYTLVECESTHNIFDKVLCASAAIEASYDKVERGSTSRERKAKSLFGRWTEGKNNPVDNEGGAIGNGILITRDTVVSSEIKLGRGKNSPKTTVEYRVLGLYDKYYNKWFMTG